MTDDLNQSDVQHFDIAIIPKLRIQSLDLKGDLKDLFTEAIQEITYLNNTLYWLIDTYAGWSEDGTFTLPDGNIYYKDKNV